MKQNNAFDSDSTDQYPTAPNDIKNDKPPTNWLSELRGLALMLLAVIAFNSLVAKPFYIPSESMLPNLLIGDRLIISKYPYGWNWTSLSYHVLPRGNWRVAGKTPAYGDIIVPTHPTQTEDYIKRVVALPGDRIAVRNGQIILNGTPISQQVEPALHIPMDDNMRCDFGINPKTGQPYNYAVTGANGQNYCEVPVLRETMPNGASYLIIDHMEQPLDNYPEIAVPEGSVFVMGDNRDHSADSRAEIWERGLGGPVPLENVGGRAEFITFSLDGTTSWNPISWFTSMRGERAWSTLRPPISAPQSGQQNQ